MPGGGCRAADAGRRMPGGGCRAADAGRRMPGGGCRAADAGRRMPGGVKHRIKRCWRFCNNERVEPADAMRGVVRRLVGKRKNPLLVALDWVDVREFRTLVASAVLKGRSVPLCWASCEGHAYDGHRSRNAFEQGLLLVPRSMVPRSMVPRSMVPRVEDGGPRVILLADRGFGRRRAPASFLRRQGFSYLIRIQPKVTVRLKGFHGKLLDYPVKKGVARVPRDVAYRRRGGRAERRRPLAHRPAEAAGRVLVPDDRPGGHRPPEGTAHRRAPPTGRAPCTPGG